MSQPQQRRPPNVFRSPPGARLAIMKGQDRSRFTDVYHAVLTTPWWMFFAGLIGLLIGTSLIFALLYLADPARPPQVGFIDVMFFAFETFASMNFTSYVPQSHYANTIVSTEGFVALLMTAIFTGAMFARFSRPYSRILFSNCAVIIPFDGVPTLMFRAANQRGNSIVDAEVRLSVAQQQVSREGHAMRRFEDIKPMRERSSMFVLSWTIMHRIDRHSPLYGMSFEQMVEQQLEVVVMLSGIDESFADRVYARHSYLPDDILWDRKFVDVISRTPEGRLVVDLERFHDTEALAR